MDRSFISFIKRYSTDYVEALINLFIFFPYFFSVGKLFATLFSPWKHIVVKKIKPGFSFQDWFERMSFNAISRGMGAFLRLSLLIFYIFIEGLYILSMPIIFLIGIIYMPFSYIFFLIGKTETEKKLNIQRQFIKKHLLVEDNRHAAELWFELYYEKYVHKLKWWKLSNLLNTPPLARDWSMGYTPQLNQFSEELTSVPYQKKIKGVINRTQEIRMIENVLSKNEQANAVIVGEEGVGKHAIVDTLAKKIYEGKISLVLMYKRILKLNMEAILSSTTDQKQRESILEELFNEATEAGNIILMIENIDRYIYATGLNRVDLSLVFEKFAKSSKVQIIATTTPYLYQQCMLSNEKINRLFTMCKVREISAEDALLILLNIVPVFENRYQITIPYETITKAIELSDYYITTIPFPEKAIELIDSTCASIIVSGKKIVMPDDVNKILTEKTSVPTSLSDELKNTLLHLEQNLSQHIVSQTDAISTIASTLRRSFLLMGKRKKPLASFLFLGPTGVGKTQTAKALASIFFNSESSCLRLDMSEYQSVDDIPHLIGSFDNTNPGLLTKIIREHPYGVLLLDEIEKAHKDLIHIFLTMIDEGYVLDGNGKRVDCKNLIIIATSNAASDIIFSNPGLTNADIVQYCISKSIFTPEFINRFDGLIVYKPLETAALKELAKKLIVSIAKTIATMYNVTIVVSDTTLNTIVETKCQPEFGARDLDRALSKELEDIIAMKILLGQAKSGDTIYL